MLELEFSPVGYGCQYTGGIPLNVNLGVIHIEGVHILLGKKGVLSLRIT